LKEIIVEEEKIEGGDLSELKIKVPFGTMVITSRSLTITRDEGATKIVVHQHYCNVTKGLRGHHDSEDLHDIPWKNIGICLDPNEDTLLVGLQNDPWTVSFTHLGKTIKLPPENM
jgi:hypothetical protein